MIETTLNFHTTSMSSPFSTDNGDPKFCVSEATDPTHDHDMQVAMELQEAFDKEEEDLIVKALASRNPDHELLISEEQRDVRS